MNESFTHRKHRSRAPSRKRDPAKFAAIARAACQVLSANGPRLTQIADVARTADIATGTVYLYVAEKDALLDLALRNAARFDLPKGTKPVKFAPRKFRKTVQDALQQRLTWPVLEQALHAPPSRDTLTAILTEAYEMLDREQKLIAFFDRCSREVPVLERLYTKGARHRYFNDFEACISSLSAAGHVRQDIDLAAAARAAIEMLVWMAMRRRGDSDPPRCDEDAARTASIAVATAGLTRP